MKLKTDLIQTVQGKSFKQKTFRITNSDKKKLSINDIRDYVDTLNEQLGDNKKYVVRGMNCYRNNITLKGFNDTSVNDDFEEYYNNKAVDPKKFEQFDQINITMLEGIKPKKIFTKSGKVAMSVFKK